MLTRARPDAEGRFADDPAALDGDVEALRAHDTTGQIVELGIAAATFKGFGTMVAAFGLAVAP